MINNQGQVAGQAVLSGDTAFHPFLWTQATGMQDLGVLPGDLVGASLAINNNGDVKSNFQFELHLISYAVELSRLCSNPPK